MTAIVGRYAQICHVFTERGGRGILADADPENHLFAIHLLPGDTAPLLYKLAENLKQFFAESDIGATFEEFCESNCLRLVTATGWDPLRLGIQNFSRAIYFGVPPTKGKCNEVVRNVVMMVDDFLRWRWPKAGSKVKLVEWIVPSEIELEAEELETPRKVRSLEGMIL